MLDSHEYNDQSDKILQQAHRAFDRGDYAAVRGMARRLSEPDIPVQVREEAKALLERIGPDKMAMALFGACMVFLVIVLIAYVF